MPFSHLTFLPHSARPFTTRNNFSFKCHRKDPGAGQARGDAQLFAVNDISFHMQHGTFSTAGSDGTINFWDKDSKTRLKSGFRVSSQAPRHLSISHLMSRSKYSHKRGTSIWELTS